MVSIPNGMEFYVSYLLMATKRAVSIPNGMEFYLLLVSILDAKC